MAADGDENLMLNMERSVSKPKSTSHSAIQLADGEWSE
ncbi:hypothetical protein COLO4_10325 [Corchorus olitorius]|uniref:Uncharacterized protein n=1 Tax=Corchorus olitorius TaxID=93759 RepID=A0A1R3K914_9ROSI|nr:hypothetical protein COLO4_10325 [Corchorus olitorius]